MNKIIFSLSVGLLSMSAFAQTVKTESSGKISRALVQITGIDVNNKTEVSISFDQGDKTQVATTEQVVRDKNGNAVEFRTMDEALKFLQRDRYKHISTFTYTFDDIKIKQYLMEKRTQKELKFKIGDGVSVTTGPLKGMYGTIIYYDEKPAKYLIRFTGTQQIYFSESEIIFWEK